MIMRDMDRASTMNPTMVDMSDTPHWVDRSLWTETSVRPAPSTTAGLDPRSPRAADCGRGDRPPKTGHRAAHGDPPGPDGYE